jgi:RimJ/RimL family protein N-acetyltransferase
VVQLSDLEPVISTVRLRLELIAPAEARAMLAGQRGPNWHPEYPRKDDLDAVSMVGAEGGCWGPRHLVRAFDSLVVGSIGFFGPPQPGTDGVPEAEIGYGLVTDARGHGAATEAVRALLELTDQLGVRVKACVDPGNTAGVRVLAKCRFTELRGSNDDGQLVMVRPLT